MSDQVIKCPECDAEIELGDALTGPITADGRLHVYMLSVGHEYELYAF